MAGVYSNATIGIRIGDRKLTTGDRLWIAGEALAVDVFRSGNSPANPGIYLRWKDVDVRKEGKIEGEDLKRVVVRPGQGISMFIEKMVKSDFNLIETRQTQTGKGALTKLALEKGYTEIDQIHWFKLQEGKVLPIGLEVVFDNDPPGHCTLTVTREMTVEEFLDLVSTHIIFSYIGSDILGKKG